ncbi:uncharacterized protein involved in response to NO [Citreimonas salinaria]|uniref:Uncharacterized protein involved in response to NO n=2 Tax=Citreimonas salinaria TaxID=321339 RepID=A0A1H3F4S8_9RHOB|nr:uncharacterized protein involved in response to NO [Citreimonas salinaria]
MFVLAGAWAIAASVAVVRRGALPAGSPFESVASWHAHEMVFGFGSAAFAGYALTAMKSWSARNGLRTRGVAALVLLWILSRIAAFGGLGAGPWLLATAGAGFLAAVAVILLRAAWLARRGGSLALFATLLTALQMATTCGASWPGSGVVGLSLLLSVAGGRIVAAFTLNAVHHDDACSRRFRLAHLLGVPAAAAIGLSLMLDLVDPGRIWPTPGLLLVAAAAEAARLLLWQARRVWRNSLLLMLHLAYLWLPVGLALVALSRSGLVSISRGDALHALAVGAVSCSIYAVTARAVARRRRRLHAAPLDVAGFVLLWTAAATRVFASPDMMQTALFLWCAGWIIFLSRHGAALLSPSPRPVFSGPKKE